MNMLELITPLPPVSRKNERQCTRCQAWFWAWSGIDRKRCYYCDPPSVEETKRLLADITGPIAVPSISQLRESQGGGRAEGSAAARKPTSATHIPQALSRVQYLVRAVLSRLQGIHPSFN